MRVLLPVPLEHTRRVIPSIGVLICEKDDLIGVRCRSRRRDVFYGSTGSIARVALGKLRRRRRSLGLRAGIRGSPNREEQQEGAEQESGQDHVESRGHWTSPVERTGPGDAGGGLCERAII